MEDDGREGWQMKKMFPIKIMTKAVFTSPLLLLILTAKNLHAGVCVGLPETSEPKHSTDLSPVTDAGRSHDRQPAVHHYLFDPVLKQSWAVMVDCKHAGRPAWLVPVANSTPAATAAVDSGSSPINTAWVRGGTEVLLWQTPANGVMRMQLAGVALESAPLGGLVDVRVRGSGMLLRGMVRGPGSIEMLGSAKGWRQQ